MRLPHPTHWMNDCQSCWPQCTGGKTEARCDRCVSCLGQRRVEDRSTLLATDSFKLVTVSSIVTVLWREEGYTMKYCLSPREILRAQEIFHHIPWLESQYSHSQLPLLANNFSYWLRELAIFSRIHLVSRSIWVRIHLLRTLPWQL